MKKYYTRACNFFYGKNSEDKIKKKIDKKDIYEFYFVINLMGNKDDLILNSYKDAINKKKEENLSVLDTFLQQIDHDRHFQILKNVSFYI